MPSCHPYKRVLLKLSGETLMGSSSSSFDADACSRIASIIHQLHQENVQVAIVIGAGNLFRGRESKQLNFDRTPADHMGMLATLMNGIALQESLKKVDCPSRVMSALECNKVVEPYIWSRAVDHLESGSVVIFVGGVGSPFFTTDTAAALKACEISANIFLKATKVDGVYDKDPNKYADAKRFSSLSYSEALTKNVQVMDATAIALCMENNIPILVFDVFKENQLSDVLLKQESGTLITNEINN